jgi:hypothetical protein
MPTILAGFKVRYGRSAASSDQFSVPYEPVAAINATGAKRIHQDRQHDPLSGARRPPLGAVKRALPSPARLRIINGDRVDFVKCGF